MDDAAALAAPAERWMAIWRGGDTAPIDDLHAPDFVDHAPAGRRADRDGFKAGVAELYAAFPDFAVTTEDTIADPGTGRVAVRWSAVGTHRGPFLGRPPTGRRRFTASKCFTSGTGG